MPLARMTLFGATGDLAGRYLLPALAALHAAGRLPVGFALVGAARTDMDDDAFRRHVAERLGEHAAAVPAASRDAIVRATRYRRVDYADPRSVGAALEGPTVAYLALPARVYADVLTALRACGLPPGSRVAVEKPFGTSLESAVALNGLLAHLDEAAVYRVDHVLGMATTQNLLAMRLANPVLDAVWNAAHVERVEVRWEEVIALEGRAGFYDHTGALGDVIQSHVLQLFAIVAMELPARIEDLWRRKLDALRAARPRGDVAACTRRARYTAGRLADGQPVPDYVAEAGVDAARDTETFAELSLAVETPRWAGTPFVLRAGKALRRQRCEVVARLRQGGGELRVGIDGPDTIALTLTGGEPGAPAPVTLSAPPPAAELPAYGRVLLDLLSGGSALAVSGEVAEEAWRVVAPVTEAWAQGRVPMQAYRAGSDGP